MIRLRSWTAFRRESVLFGDDAACLDSLKMLNNGRFLESYFVARYLIPMGIGNVCIGHLLCVIRRFLPCFCVVFPSLLPLFLTMYQLDSFFVFWCYCDAFKIYLIADECSYTRATPKTSYNGSQSVFSTFYAYPFAFYFRLIVG